MAEKKSREEFMLKVGVDVSEALKGLKEIQCEAIKATAELKRLEEQQKAIDPGLFKKEYLCTWVEDEDLPTRPEMSG